MNNLKKLSTLIIISILFYSCDADLLHYKYFDNKSDSTIVIVVIDNYFGDPYLFDTIYSPGSDSIEIGFIIPPKSKKLIY